MSRVRLPIAIGLSAGRGKEAGPRGGRQRGYGKGRGTWSAGRVPSTGACRALPFRLRPGLPVDYGPSLPVDYGPSLPVDYGPSLPE